MDGNPWALHRATNAPMMSASFTDRDSQFWRIHAIALRLIDDYLPEVERIITDSPNEGVWREMLADEQLLLRVLLDASDTGQIIDQFEKRFGRDDRFQLLFMPVAAALPQNDEKPEDDNVEQDTLKARGFGRLSLSRQELNHQIADMAQMHSVYIATVVLSAIVASIGMLRDRVAVIIGAMVIAPLLGPKIALSFAATVGDTALIRRALATNIVGLAIVLGHAAACGVFLSPDEFGHKVMMRTDVHLSDVVLALASGAAGALAIWFIVLAVLIVAIILLEAGQESIALPEGELSDGAPDG